MDGGEGGVRGWGGWGGMRGERGMRRANEGGGGRWGGCKSIKEWFMKRGSRGVAVVRAGACGGAASHRAARTATTEAEPSRQRDAATGTCAPRRRVAARRPRHRHWRPAAQAAERGATAGGARSQRAAPQHAARRMTRARAAPGACQ